MDALALFLRSKQALGLGIDGGFSLRYYAK